MSELIKTVNDKQKRATVALRTGDTAKVYQRIKEGDKERVQMFQGTVIRVTRDNSHTASFTVRKIASGVGVEKSFLLHSPLITKIEITARGKVRRNFLSYMRKRVGKSTRLTATRFDRANANELVGGAPEEVAVNTPATDADEAAVEVLESEEASTDNQPVVSEPTEAAEPAE